MIRVDAERSVHFCDRTTRRDFLHTGSLAAVGLSLPHYLALQAQGAVKEKADKNCIMTFNLGGPGQVDPWDPKPGAPEEGSVKRDGSNFQAVRLAQRPISATHFFGRPRRRRVDWRPRRAAM